MTNGPRSETQWLLKSPTCSAKAQWNEWKGVFFSSGNQHIHTEKHIIPQKGHYSCGQAWRRQCDVAGIMSCFKGRVTRQKHTFQRTTSDLSWSRTCLCSSTMIQLGFTSERLQRKKEKSGLEHPCCGFWKGQFTQGGSSCGPVSPPQRCQRSLIHASSDKFMVSVFVLEIQHKTKENKDPSSTCLLWKPASTSKWDEASGAGQRSYFPFVSVTLTTCSSINKGF